MVHEPSVTLRGKVLGSENMGEGGQDSALRGDAPGFPEALGAQPSTGVWVPLGPPPRGHVPGKDKLSGADARDRGQRCHPESGMDPTAMVSFKRLPVLGVVSQAPHSCQGPPWAGLQRPQPLGPRLGPHGCREVSGGTLTPSGPCTCRTAQPQGPGERGHPRQEAPTAGSALPPASCRQRRAPSCPWA